MKQLLIYHMLIIKYLIKHLFYYLYTNIINLSIIKGFIIVMIEYIITIAILLGIAGFYFIYLKPLRKIKRLSREFQQSGYKVYTYPYNPLNIPIFKPILECSKEGDPMKFYKKNFSDYDIIVGNLFKTPAICALSPAARKQLAKNQIDFAYKKMPFIMEITARILGKGLVFSEGDEWKRKRRILSKFFTFEFITSKIPEIYEICQKCLDQFEQKSKIEGTNDEYKVKMADLTIAMFSRIIMSLFLGIESLEQKINGVDVAKFMVKLVTEHTIRANQVVPLIFGIRYMKLGLTKIDRDLTQRKILFDNWAIQYIDNFIERIKSGKDTSPPNLLKLLYDPSKGQDEVYNKQELLDELKVFLFAGTDTTSHWLEMMIYLTAKQSSIQKQARQEINSIDQTGINSIEQLKKFKFMEAIQKQTTRFYGPLPVNFPRVTTKPHSFNGVHIQQGTSIQFYSTPTHFNPAIYSEPFEFKPNRWLDENKEIDSACLVGFGMGPRSCIGLNLAHFESKIAFYSFFKRYSEIFVPEKLPLRWGFMIQAENLEIKVKKVQK